MNDLARKRNQEPSEPEERIWTLKQLMTACRARVPVILRQIDKMFADPEMSDGDRMKLMDLVLDRGFGKPSQTLRVSEENVNGAGGSAVKVYIPDNNRSARGPMIDSQTLEVIPEVAPGPAQDDAGDDDPLDDIESAEVIPIR